MMRFRFNIFKKAIFMNGKEVIRADHFITSAN